MCCAMQRFYVVDAIAEKNVSFCVAHALLLLFRRNSLQLTFAISCHEWTIFHRWFLRSTEVFCINRRILWAAFSQFRYGRNHQRPIYYFSAPNRRHFHFRNSLLRNGKLGFIADSSIDCNGFQKVKYILETWEMIAKITRFARKSGSVLCEFPKNQIPIKRWMSLETFIRNNYPLSQLETEW